MSEHTKVRLHTGPANTEAQALVFLDGIAIAEVFSREAGMSASAYARRFVACWNACLGITTEVLEAEPSSLNDLINKQRDDRDELIAALRGIQKRADDAVKTGAKVDHVRELMVVEEIARALLAKVTA